MIQENVPLICDSCEELIGSAKQVEWPEEIGFAVLCWRCWDRMQKLEKEKEEQMK